MKQVDLCASDDHDTIGRLLAAIQALGGRAEGEDFELGTGLHRFRFPDGELTVFADAWSVDVAGPEHLVDRLLADMAAAH